MIEEINKFTSKSNQLLIVLGLTLLLILLLSAGQAVEKRTGRQRPRCAGENRCGARDRKGRRRREKIKPAQGPFIPVPKENEFHQS